MMKPLLLVPCLVALLVATACSSDKEDQPSVPGNGTQAGSTPVPAPSEVAAGFRSTVKALAFDAVTALPKAPASAASRAECFGIVDKPKSAVARSVADAGWGVTGEGRIGGYDVVSFAGSFEAGTSGSCRIDKGNVAIFEGGKIRAIAYAPIGNARTIGNITPFGEGGLRIWDGDILPSPLADMRTEGKGLIIDALAKEERLCGGKVVVPGIVGTPIGKARAALLAAKWKPVTGAADREDPREAELAAAGIAEVDGCSGTGFGFCSFAYRHAGATLSVTTVGEDADPTVVSYSAGCTGG